jgi:hypothetical protein
MDVHTSRFEPLSHVLGPPQADEGSYHSDNDV